MLIRGAMGYFKNCENLNWKGFSLNCITVVFIRGYMKVWDFDEVTGKCNEGVFFVPDTSRDMLKRMILHCSEDKIQNQLVNGVTVLM